MLAFLIGLLVALGPLLRGAWDLWAQTLLLTAFVSGVSLWFAARILSGYVPLPSRRVLFWAFVMGALGALSAYSSPVAVYAVPEWRWHLAGMGIIVTLTVVSKDERIKIDMALQTAAWVLLLLAFYQRFHEGLGRPPGSMLKENIFAGTCLFFLPLALQRKDYLLLTGLSLAVLWSQSVGAWLALAAVMLLYKRHESRVLPRIGLALGAVCAIGLLLKLRDPAVLDRWRWWGAAAGMFWDRPWLGFGPGSFAYVLPCVSDGGGIGSLYAHQAVLETLAGNGWAYSVVWFGVVVILLRMGGPHKTFGALAVLLHSLWDITLSMPANFWLFCYFIGSALPQGSRAVNVPARWKVPLAVLVLAAGGLTSVRVSEAWRAERMRGRAMEMLSSDGTRGTALEARDLLRRSVRLSDHPETRLLIAETDLRIAPAGSREGLLAAAAQFEAAAALNPYRPSVWTGLERIYGDLGMGAESANAARRGAAVCSRLRR